MKKQFLLGSLILSMLFSTFSFSMNYQDSPQYNKILQVFYSLCYRLYNSTNEKEAYAATKALNKLSRLFISKNTQATHNKLLIEFNVLEPNGCFSETDFLKTIPLHEIDTSAEEYQQRVVQELRNEQKHINDNEKLLIFLFDLICFVSHKQERHELCKAFFELMQAVNENNKQLKNLTLIKYGLVDDQGILFEETIKSAYCIPIYLDLVNPDTEGIVHYFYLMNPIENPERVYEEFKKDYLENNTYIGM
jgi:hypothetical protein